MFGTETNCSQDSSRIRPPPCLLWILLFITFTTGGLVGLQVTLWVLDTITWWIPGIESQGVRHDWVTHFHFTLKVRHDLKQEILTSAGLTDQCAEKKYNQICQHGPTHLGGVRVGTGRKAEGRDKKMVTTSKKSKRRLNSWCCLCLQKPPQACCLHTAISLSWKGTRKAVWKDSFFFFFKLSVRCSEKSFLYWA